MSILLHRCLYANLVLQVLIGVLRCLQTTVSSMQTGVRLVFSSRHSVGRLSTFSRQTLNTVGRHYYIQQVDTATFSRQTLHSVDTAARQYSPMLTHRTLRQLCFSYALALCQVVLCISSAEQTACHCCELPATAVELCSYQSSASLHPCSPL